jgi:hypothetical protein
MDEAEYSSRQDGRDLLDHCYIGRLNDAKGQWLRLLDKGRGVDLEQIFLIGESGKRGQNYRGQKGEGEILSFLVCARENVQKWMFSQDWAVTARFVPYNGNDKYEVLAIDVYRTNSGKRHRGTEWRFELHRDIKYYFENLGEYFPDLSRRGRRREETRRRQRDEENRRRRNRYAREEKAKQRSKSTSSTKQIITPRANKPARLYVRGIWIKDLDDALFSYNLDTEAINRDRSMVDDMELLDGIQKAFNGDDVTVAQMKRYWEQGLDAKGGSRSKLEHLRSLNFSDERHRKMMRQAFKRAFGRKAVLLTDRFAAIDASTDGYQIVDLLPNVLATAIALGIKTDVQCAGYVDDMIPAKKVTKKHKALIKQLQVTSMALGLPAYECTVVLKFKGEPGTLAKHGNSHNYVLKSVLDGDRKELLRTWLHETQHGATGAGDGTREFTGSFEKLLADALFGELSDVAIHIEKFRRM